MKNNLQMWPQRPWILSIFLAIAGFAFYLVIEEKAFVSSSDQFRVGLATFITVGAMAFAFTLERVRWLWVILFSLAWGLILGFVAHSTQISEVGKFDVHFSLCSGLIAAGIALPLFQTIRQHGQISLPYKDLHENAWNDVLCWFAGWIFVGLSFSLAHLLASLFELIGIDELKILLKESWFIWLFVGASFGAALGVVKENKGIVDSLQKLAMAILSILTPILCISLVAFLVVLPFAGLQPLWDTTRLTTPILLSCAIGAITLANAIIRNSSVDESQNKLMRYSAIGLSACILPLAIIAFISIQQRIEQHGLTPDRIWGLVAVLVAVAYGFAYLWSLIKSREKWASNLRVNNTRMAALLCLVTLFLALPIMDFAKISVDSQLARIQDGRIPSDQVDFVAFAFDFGEQGRDALRDMKKSNDTTWVNGATLALAADYRWKLKKQLDEAKSASLVLSKLTIFPKPVSIPDELKNAITKQAACLDDYCLLIWKQDSLAAKLVTPYCPSHHRIYRDTYNKEDSYKYCPPQVMHLIKKADKWKIGNSYNYSNQRTTANQKEEDKTIISNAIEQREVEIRTVERKQIFIGGKPVGQVY